MHLQDTSHTLFLVFCRIQHVGSGVQRSGIYAEECQLTHERVCHNLECQSSKGLVVRRVSLYLIALQIDALDCRDIGRRGHILEDRVQKLLHALVSVSGTAAYGNRRTLAGSLAQNILHLLHIQLLALQILHHQIVIQLADLLDHLGPYSSACSFMSSGTSIMEISSPLSSL